MTPPRHSPPPVFPLKRPGRAGLVRTMPPAVFPAILGLLWLGLGWRAALGAFALPGGPADACLGAVTLLWAFAVMAYGTKLLRRPGVLAQDLQGLPGRDGLSALALSISSVALVLAPIRPALAMGVMIAGLATQLGLLVAVLALSWAGPQERRAVTPVWQTLFGGLGLVALPALTLGWTGTALGLAILSGVGAAAIWLVSARQFWHRNPPAPLRPLLALHIVPAAVLGLAAQGLQLATWGQGLALIAAGALVALLVSGRWLLQSGYTSFLGALIFPLAASATLFLALDGAWRAAGLLVLVAATAAGLPIAYRLLKDWMTGSLAMQTNAAEA